jgi:hypothetical protein
MTGGTFHDALAPLLNGLDQATPLDRSGNPAQPAAVRALFAERLIRGRHWCYLAKEKSFAVEIHLGRALCAMFFHTPRMGVADPRPYLPPRCQRLPEFMPALVRVVSAAPLSGYVTDLFLGLIATYPTASLLRGLVQAASGLIHSDDSQIGRSSPSSHYESRNCRQRHASRSPPA